LFLPGPVRLGIVLIQFTSDVLGGVGNAAAINMGRFERIVLWRRVSLCWILGGGDVEEQRIEDMTYNMPKKTRRFRVFPRFYCGTARFEETGMNLLSEDSCGAV